MARCEAAYARAPLLLTPSHYIKNSYRSTGNGLQDFLLTTACRTRELGRWGMCLFSVESRDRPESFIVQAELDQLENVCGRPQRGQYRSDTVAPITTYPPRLSAR